MAIMISSPIASFVRTQTMAKDINDGEKFYETEIDEFGFLKHFSVWQ